MLITILAIAAAVFAVGWCRYKLIAMAFMYFIEINRYRFPSDIELKFCIQKVSGKMFSRWTARK